ncbi:hypothetical protein [Bacillus pumilus]|uniref:hypothetical protein n=1 Tax=Bacillus pumilus TaxID=1408 RepID=UPI00227EBD34|nr:hypothetical protein [Bacillus pumilus]MCY7500219.1 hypothetical protein [Bacillus pumilus]MCY7528457.1 hypothetical protein [Bacillus pumilus]MED4441498.1 hypothetical protein [Bacillus pumilus]MED4490028.1 hypothetical protein [Bacillus pumilus]
MSEGEKEIRKNFVVGEINTTIRNVNELSDKEIIERDWQSIVLSNGEFHALLIIERLERKIVFPSEYWLTSTNFSKIREKVIELEQQLL